MRDHNPREVEPEDLKRLGELLEQHGIEALLASHKPPSVAIRFDVEWLKDRAMAASFPRLQTTGPYYITLSPMLLEYGLTDRVALSSIALHELGHILDRVQKWATARTASDEAIEYSADDFVIRCGWREGLVETLRRTITLAEQAGFPQPMSRRRLLRLQPEA